MSAVVSPGLTPRQLVLAGRLDEAESACRLRLAADPSDAAALNDLANVLEEQGRADEAEGCYRRAIELRSDSVEAHYNLALLLQMRRALEAARDGYQTVLALRPDIVQAYNNLGAVLRDLGQLTAAEQAFGEALRLRPDYADAQFNQAMCRLAMGDFAQGWRQYEWRWRTKQADCAARGFRQPLWLGGGDLAGRTILLHAEQGLGDTLQFCRFAPRLKALGARVVLEVQPGLERLLSGLAGVSAVIARGQPLPPFHMHTPLMSLPLALSVTPESLSGAPYLEADKALARDWARRLCGSSGRRIGLVWAGAARADRPHAAATDQRRSLPLAAFAPLADVPQASFYSLQKGSPAQQLGQLRQARWSGPDLIDHSDQWGDFADTAAFVANLDLVITCDTSMAHLAGAMGKPVWILNRFDGCWRWPPGRDDSDWYSSVRLFHQAERGRWADVIDRVVRALK
jgi:hypothetical protein